MSRRKLKTIGVIGGMGPEAGAYFFERIVRETAAGRDQDHPPVVLCSLPQIPDRTPAILHGGPSPVPAILRGLRALRKAGADFAVMSCISAHYFYPRLAPRSPVPFYSLIDDTLAAIGKMRPVPRTIGLIATTGTVRSGIVARPFEAAGFEVIVPSARDQERLMTAIYGKKGLKAGVTGGPAPGDPPRHRRRPRPPGRRGDPGRVYRDPPGPPGNGPARSSGRAHGHRGPGGRAAGRRPPETLGGEATGSDRGHVPGVRVPMKRDSPLRGQSLRSI